MLTIAGAGAVGITLATHLAAAGKPVRLYARDKDRAAFAAAARLTLDRPRGGPLTAPLPTLTPQLFDADTRYLVIATKFGAMDALLGQLRGAPPTLTVVSTLNGVRALPLIRERLPALKATALTIMFNAQHSGVLHAQLTTKPAVMLARVGAARDATLHALLSGCGLALTESQDEQACWGKLLINLANAIGALTQSTFRDLLSCTQERNGSCVVRSAFCRNYAMRSQQVGTAFAEQNGSVLRLNGCSPYRPTANSSRQG